MQPPCVPLNEAKPTTSAPFPGSLTPGWNDPPPLKENATPERRRLNLNKRVAFPLHSGAAPQTSATSQILPNGLPITSMPTTLMFPVATNSEISTLTNSQHSTDQVTDKSN